MSNATIAAMNSHSGSALLPRAAVVTTWIAAAVCFGAMMVLDLRLADAGRDDLQQILNGNALLLIPFLSATVVGSALVLRRPHHPVGWLFLVLAIVMAASGVIDGYAAYGAVARPGSLPGAQFVAVIGASTFIPWLMLPGLILLLTPSGRLPSRVTQLTVWITVLGGVVSFSAGMFRPYTGDYASLEIIHNLLEVSRGADVLSVIRWTGIVAVHLGVLAGAAAIIVRFRAARAAERRQLRWLGMAAIPLVLFLFGASIAAVLNSPVITWVMAGCFVAIIPWPLDSRSSSITSMTSTGSSAGRLVGRC